MKQNIIISMLFSIVLIQNIYSSENKCTKLLAKIIQYQDCCKDSLFLISWQGHDQQRMKQKKPSGLH